mmetsp:Transcript_24547/g.92747  ORF Transcript_24547/g.92747 Transcript_24547/m.92747 type:complete len:375 (+) Transcript_24547:316-1440(+)
MDELSVGSTNTRDEPAPLDGSTPTLASPAAAAAKRVAGWMVSPPASRAMASAPLETRLRVTPVIADMRLRPSAEGALAPCADAAAAWSGVGSTAMVADSLRWRSTHRMAAASRRASATALLAPAAPSAAAASAAADSELAPATRLPSVAPSALKALPAASAAVDPLACLGGGGSEEAPVSRAAHSSSISLGVPSAAELTAKQQASRALSERSPMQPLPSAPSPRSTRSTAALEGARSSSNKSLRPRRATSDSTAVISLVCASRRAFCCMRAGRRCIASLRDPPAALASARRAASFVLTSCSSFACSSTASPKASPAAWAQKASVAGSRSMVTVLPSAAASAAVASGALPGRLAWGTLTRVPSDDTSMVSATSAA